MHFTKMQGLGNDYLYVDGFRESLPDPAAWPSGFRTGTSAPARTE